jgi:hypothetical protein
LGSTPSPENSIGKLLAGSMLQDVATFTMDLQAQPARRNLALNPSRIRSFDRRCRFATRSAAGLDEPVRFWTSAGGRFE